MTIAGWLFYSVVGALIVVVPYRIYRWYREKNLQALSKTRKNV